MQRTSFHADIAAATSRGPFTYQVASKVPQIGEVFPEIWADSTQGPLRFHDWARGAFVVFFSYSVAYTDMVEADLVAFCEAQEDFAARGVKLVGVSQTDAPTKRVWLRDLEFRRGVRVRFPILADEDGGIARTCGLYHENSVSLSPMNKTFVLGRDLRILAASEHPDMVPRLPSETLRLVDALMA